MKEREKWLDFKTRQMGKYQKALGKMEVDTDIIPLLNLINSKNEFATLSSCSGRIAVLDTPKFGDKLNSKFLGKWHRVVELKEVIDAVNLSKETCWLITYPPILHIACRTFEIAERLMEVSNNNGFKSCIISKKGVVEVNTHDRMEMLISINGDKLISDTNLSRIVDISNQKLKRSKNKLVAFKKVIEDFKGNY